MTHVQTAAVALMIVCVQRVVAIVMANGYSTISVTNGFTVSVQMCKIPIQKT